MSVDVDNVTNGQIYAALLELKGDVGSLKTTTAIQLEGMKSHTSRIGVLEAAYERQKGSVKTWGVVATAVAGVVSAVPTVVKLLTGKV